MQQISYEELLKHDFELVDTKSSWYKKTKEISDNILFSKYPANNKVFRFVNNYVIEKYLKDYFSRLADTNVKFLDDDHEYFHAGEGTHEPDLIDDFGTTIEIKAGWYDVSNYDWVNNSNHNASYTFYYNKGNYKLYAMDYNTKEAKFQRELIIMLPFDRNQEKL